MSETLYAVAIFKGQRVRSTLPAPFTSIDAIKWRTPSGVFSTFQLRVMDPRTDIVYAPRRTAIVPFSGIGSNLADLDYRAGKSADDSEEDLASCNTFE